MKPVVIRLMLALLVGVSASPASSGAGEPSFKSPATGSALLNADDRKKYDEALNLINVSEGRADLLEKAYQILSDLARRNPESGYPQAGFADLKYRLAAMGRGSYAEALAMAQMAIKLDPTVADAHVVVAKVMLQQNNLFGAQQAADKAIAAAPDKPEAMFVKASVAEKFKRYDEAEQWYRKAIERHTDKRRQSNVYFWLGEMFKNKKPRDIAAAAAAYEKSIELAGDGPWKLNNVGVFFINHTDRYDQGIDYLNRALKLMNFETARVNLGLAQFYKWGDAYLNPAKYRGATQKPEDPKTITEQTGVTPERAFVVNPIGSRTPTATIAMLKSGMIQDVDVTAPGADGTALISAAYGNHLDVVKMLVAKGANVNAEDKENKSTPIFYAVANENVEMVRFLVDNGARLNRADTHGLPLVARALEVATPDDLRILSYLLERGADPTVPDGKGDPLVARAVRKGNPAAVDLLVTRYRVDPNAKVGGGSPILAHAAVQSGTAGRDIVRILLKTGANPWVKYGRSDVLYTLNASYPDPKVFPSFKENSEMILAARKSVPKPADFGRTFPEP